MPSHQESPQEPGETTQKLSLETFAKATGEAALTQVFEECLETIYTPTTRAMDSSYKPAFRGVNRQGNTITFDYTNYTLNFENVDGVWKYVGFDMPGIPEHVEGMRNFMTYRLNEERPVGFWIADQLNSKVII